MFLIQFEFINENSFVTIFSSFIGWSFEIMNCIPETAMNNLRMTLTGKKYVFRPLETLIFHSSKSSGNYVAFPCLGKEIDTGIFNERF
jgi:hypothetical protein